MPAASRRSDERRLDWLALSARGVRVKEIATRYGVNPRSADQALYLVRGDDREAHADCPGSNSKRTC